MVEKKYTEACREIAREILSRRIEDPSEIARIKARICGKFSLRRTPSNPDIIRFYDGNKAQLKRILKLKPVRSISGIVILSVMCAPFPCPHGRCSYCPRFPNAPVSYTGREPAAMRAIQSGFDPCRQIKSRLKQLESMGHSTQKIELIIQGGTFNATPPSYRENFMMGVMEGILGFRPRSYEEALMKAERSRYRLTGLTLETRPDQVSERQVDWMLRKGFTRVELGVQTLYNSVYARVKRGHSVEDVIDATRRLKDAGFKVCYHIMPGLPDTTVKMDLNIFRMLFEREEFRPDMLKIYPTLVLDGTELHDWWRQGLYKPLSTEEAAELIEIVKANFIPKWVRIMRIQRDIPVFQVEAGVRKGNLREIVGNEMRIHGLRCKCIRCREYGHKKLRGLIGKPIRISVNIYSYTASRGLEYFIAAEDISNDVLVGFLRLRRPSDEAWRPEVAGKETFIVRELHVYGEALPLGFRSDETWQHRGVGSTLLREAERLASEKGAEKIAVISGVGAREYYYKHGYFRDGPYVSKIVE